jgi:1,2-diacylglycerol 3-beta-galactosyltransferase
MRNIRPAVVELLAQLDQFKARVRRIDNRAVFDVAEILAGILARPGRQAEAAALPPAHGGAAGSRAASTPALRDQVAVG